MQYNLTNAIQEHYDLASPYYEKLWGKHLHHGYYQTGHESKEEAADNLIKYLVELVGIREGARVLDVGCGIGGTSIWLAENLGCKVTGVTISPIQVQMATEAAQHLRNKPTFLLDDANNLSITGSYDIVWAVEVISHLSNRSEFFRRMSRLLVPGGRFCEAAWLKEEGLSIRDEAKYIGPIEEGMLVSLPTLSEYKKHIADNGLRLLHYEDISSKVAKTWDICLDIAKDRTLWRLASQHSKEFISFLKSFKAMRNGFRSGTFRYGILVIEKP
jgi:cyclopropane fatty-acyl-phospholipid synthase-like methyltransferase